MENYSNIDLEELENKYELLRELAIEQLDSYSNSSIKIKVHASKITHNAFTFVIKDKKAFNQITQKLNENEIPYRGRNGILKTTLSGAIKVCGIVPEDIENNLMSIEKEIYKRFNQEFGVHTFVRMDTSKHYKWVAKGKDLNNTYYFKSLVEAQDSLNNGFVKAPYSIFNVFRWRMPRTIRGNWEAPSTIRSLLKDNDIRKRDLSYEEVVNTKIDIYVPNEWIGDQNTNEGLNNLIFQSLKREIKLLIELKNMIRERGSYTDKNPTHKILRAIDYEYNLRKKLILKNDIKSNARLLEKSKILNDYTEKIISKQTKIELSNNENLSNMMSRFEYLSESFNNSELSSKAENILTPQNIDNSSEINYKTELNELLFPFKNLFNIISLKEGYTGIKLLKHQDFEIISPFITNTIVDSTSDIGIDIAQVIVAQKELLSLLDVVMYNYFAGYSAGVSIYGAIATIKGANDAKTLNKWIDEINKSDVIDPETKELITEHLKDKKTHTIWGECIGNSLLSAGQIMTIIGCPIWGVGAPLIVAGSATSLVGVGITVANKVTSGKKFDCVETPNEEELKILNDDKSVLAGGVRAGESLAHANLRWKVEALKKESSNNEAKLYWISVYSEIIKNCDLFKKHNVVIDKERMAKKIIKTVESKYSSEHTKNMRKCALGNASKEAFDQIKKYIEEYINNPENFYINTLDSHIADKSKNGNMTFSKDETDTNSYGNNKKYSHPKCTDTMRLIDNLKKCGLWNETQRSLLKRLIIKKKSDINIRGSYFKDYIKKINITENRMIYVPPILPFRIVFRSPILPFKHKTVYMFDDKKFIEDLKVYSTLPDEKKLKIDEILGSLLQEKKNSIGKTIRTKGEFNAKSNVFRPLWLEIPQLIHGEGRQI